MLCRILFVALFVVLTSFSVQADPTLITLFPTSGNFIATRIGGPGNDQITFNLEAADFTAHFFNNEAVFSTSGSSCQFPNNCLTGNIIYLGQSSLRVGYTTTIDLSTNTIQGSLRYYVTGGSPIAPNEVPVYVFSFTARGVVTENTTNRFRFDITTPTPEPASLILLSGTLTALGLKRKLRRRH